VTTQELRRVEKELNERPRKAHGFYTAGEMYRSILLGNLLHLDFETGLLNDKRCFKSRIARNFYGKLSVLFFFCKISL